MVKWRAMGAWFRVLTSSVCGENSHNPGVNLYNHSNSLFGSSHNTFVHVCSKMWSLVAWTHPRKEGLTGVRVRKRTTDLDTSLIALTSPWTLPSQTSCGFTAAHVRSFWRLGRCVRTHHFSSDHRTLSAKSSGCCKIHLQKAFLCRRWSARSFWTCLYLNGVHFNVFWRIRCVVDLLSFKRMCVHDFTNCCQSRERKKERERDRGI